MFVEGTLLEKLRKIEALHAGTRVDGERAAAKRAAERIRARLAELRAREREEVRAYTLMLAKELDALTSRVIREAIHEAVSEASETAGTKALPAPGSSEAAGAQAVSESASGAAESSPASPT